MTWSILAKDSSGTFGIGIASRFFAVGSLCPHVSPSMGCLSTQALMNPLYGAQGIALISQGLNAQQVVEKLLSNDIGREQRQLHVLTVNGESCAFTGDECVDWCGHISVPNISLAGNMLAGAVVLERTLEVFQESKGLPLAKRLILAMSAGESVGGDKRGKQSAAVLIHKDQPYPQLSLRVDDHEEPIEELKRLYNKSLDRYQPFISCLASSQNPSGIIDRSDIENAITEFHNSNAHSPIKI
jgi:uncharacterized Ntn-hydrolase superfamily protein